MGVLRTSTTQTMPGAGTPAVVNPITKPSQISTGVAGEWNKSTVVVPRLGLKCQSSDPMLPSISLKPLISAAAASMEHYSEHPSSAPLEVFTSPEGFALCLVLPCTCQCSSNTMTVMDASVGHLPPPTIATSAATTTGTVSTFHAQDLSGVDLLKAAKAAASKLLHTKTRINSMMSATRVREQTQNSGLCNKTSGTRSKGNSIGKSSGEKLVFKTPLTAVKIFKSTGRVSDEAEEVEVEDEVKNSIYLSPSIRPCPSKSTPSQSSLPSRPLRCLTGSPSSSWGPSTAKTTNKKSPPQGFYIAEPYKHSEVKIDRRSHNSTMELKEARTKALMLR